MPDPPYQWRITDKPCKMADLWQSHGPAVINHNNAEGLESIVWGRPISFQLRTSICEELWDIVDLPTGSLCHWTMSPMLTHFNPVSCLLGFKMIKMVVERLYSPSAMWSRLKLPFAIHLSRTIMDTVCICKVIWILVKHMSPRQRPSMLSRTKMVWKMDFVWLQGCLWTSNLPSGIKPKESFGIMNAHV